MRDWLKIRRGAVGAIGWSKIRRRAVGVGALVISTMLLSCGDGPSGPQPAVPGEAITALAGAQASDRALLIEIGPGATGVQAGRADLEVHSYREGDRYIVAVFGPLSGGPILRIQVADTASIPAFAVLEVASEDGELRPSVTNYGVRVDEVR